MCDVCTYNVVIDCNQGAQKKKLTRIEGVLGFVELITHLLHGCSLKLARVYIADPTKF